MELNCKHCLCSLVPQPYRDYGDMVTLNACPTCTYNVFRCNQCEARTHSQKKDKGGGRPRLVRFANSRRGLDQLGQHMRRHHPIHPKPTDKQPFISTFPPDDDTMDSEFFGTAEGTIMMSDASCTTLPTMDFTPQELRPIDFDQYLQSSQSTKGTTTTKRRPTTKTDVTSGFESLLGYNDFDYRDTIEQLIYCACTRVSEISACGVAKKMDNTTAMLFIHTACMAEDITSNKMESLSTIAHLVFPNSAVTVPTTKKAIQEQILSSRGKKSFRNLLPIPQIESLKGDHTYVSLVDLVRHTSMLATNKDYQTVRDRHLSLLKSTRFLSFKSRLEQILKEKNIDKNTDNVIVITLFWSDGFEPNRTLANRGSVWAMTVTLLFYDCCLKTIYMVRTALMSVGVDKSDHTPVFDRLRTELEGICNAKEGFPIKSCSVPSHFHKTKDKTKDTDFFILPFGCIMDNPERRGNFWLLHHSSKSHALFGHNCRYDLLKKRFECKDNDGQCNCVNKIKKYIQDGDFDEAIQLQCNQCLSFSMDRLDREGEYTSPVFEHDGEADQIPGEELFNAPGELTCSMLIKGWNYGFGQYTKGNWTKKRAEAYLHNVLCLNEAAIQRFTSHAQQKIEHDLWEKKDPSLDQECRTRVEQNLCSDPSYYQNLGRHNPLWDIFELENTFETIMHNCMNVGRHVVKALFTWASGLKLKTDLVDRLAERLQLVQNLKVEVFKARSFTGDSLGGYIAENYRALLVLAPWFFSFLTHEDFQKQSPGEPAPDNLPDMREWTKEHLKHFLHMNRVRKCQVRQYEIRGAGDETPKEKPKLSFRGISGMNKSELFVAVTKVIALQAAGKELTNDDIGYELVPPATNRGSSFKKRTEIRPFISATGWLQGNEIYSMFPEISAFFTVLMDTSLTGKRAKNRAEVHAMLFLSRMLHLLAHLTDGDPLSDFRGKSCLYGILRSTKHLLSIPWLKAIHEGGDMGEGIVKSLRPEVTRGLRKGWDRALVTRFYQRHSMLFVKEFFKLDALAEEDDVVSGSATPSAEEELLEDHDGRAPTSLTTIPDRTRNFRRYRSINVFTENVTKQIALSMVMYSGTQSHEIMIGAVVSEYKKWSVYFIDFDTIRKRDEPKRIDTLWYFKIGNLFEEGIPITCHHSMTVAPEHGLTFKGFCIAVPRLQVGKNGNRYTFICGDGTKFNKQRAFKAVCS